MHESERTKHRNRERERDSRTHPAPGRSCDPWLLSLKCARNRDQRRSSTDRRVVHTRLTATGLDSLAEALSHIAGHDIVVRRG